MRGRKPLPHNLRLLTQSSPGYDAVGRPIKTPPAFQKGGVPKPSDLTTDESHFWDLTAPEMERLDVRAALTETAERLVSADAAARWSVNVNGSNFELFSRIQEVLNLGTGSEEMSRDIHSMLPER